MARKTSRKPARNTAATTSRRELLIAKNRIKAASGMNVASDFYSALDGAVRRMIAEAGKRALENGRRTLRPYDL